MPRIDRHHSPAPIGIMSKFQDSEGNWRKTSPESYAALLRAMEIDSRQSGSSETPIRIVYPPQDYSISGRAELTFEDGTTLQIQNKLPRGLPFGYYDLRLSDGGQRTHLILTPGKCYLPKMWKGWGWALQLYALRSSQSWGMGDLGDLAEFARWSKQNLHANFILVSPINAVNPGLPQEASPYFPSSRIYKNPLYLRIDSLARVGVPRKTWLKFMVAGSKLNQKRIINRGEIFRLKMAALETLWNHFSDDSEFERFSQREQPLLEQFATFCVLFEKLGPGWRRWPARFRSPSASGIKTFQTEQQNRIGFHKWLQWLLENQFAEAGSVLPLIQDLPIGVNPDGADAWIWQHLIAETVSIGAPPDAFNTFGQNWGLPPFIPQKLRAANYEPFRHTVRAALRHAGGLRIDHAMGLFRLFWIPAHKPPTAGGYVRYPVEELLAILAIESHRAKAMIIGEDLGTVERGVRAKLHRHNILSYRVLWFDHAPKRHSSRLALSAVSTHDLPTTAGLWSGTDLASQKKAGLQPNEIGTRELKRRLRRLLKVMPETSLQEVILRTYRHLAKTEAMLLSMTLEDALAVEERPNIPGTTHQRPNWSLALPKLLESIKKEKLVRSLAAILDRRASRRHTIADRRHAIWQIRTILAKQSKQGRRAPASLTDNLSGVRVAHADRDRGNFGEAYLVFAIDTSRCGSRRI